MNKSTIIECGNQSVWCHITAHAPGYSWHVHLQNPWLYCDLQNNGSRKPWDDTSLAWRSFQTSYSSLHESCCFWKQYSSGDFLMIFSCFFYIYCIIMSDFISLWSHFSRHKYRIISIANNVLGNWMSFLRNLMACHFIGLPMTCHWHAILLACQYGMPLACY